MPSGDYNKGKGKCAAWIISHVSYAGDDCLPYPFARIADGYGQLGYMGEMWRAHVLMCTLAHGPAPSPQHESAHNCLNGHDGCCNPRHLEWKTRVENQADRYKYGQRISKRNKPRVKLTLAQVEEIRRLQGQETQQSLADRFGCSRTNIIMVQKGETWSGKKRLPKILTREQVNYIRSSDAPLADLATKFGLADSSISRIRTGKTYAYIPPEQPAYRKDEP
jgi:hypothetical protein